MLRRLFRAIGHGSGRRRLAYVLVLAAAIGGAAAIAVAISSQQSAPQPPPSAAGSISSTPPPTVHGATVSPPSGTPPVAPGTPPAPQTAASVPTYIDIPSIGVHSAIISVGKTAEGDLAVPQPGPNLNKAAWYRGSVTPGQDGPSVIEGHVDSVYGPSVFFKLGALRPGDQISIVRADHSVMRFAVNGVRSYASHADFPTTAVFGADLDQPTLRLITCSNFDSSIGHYLGNTVIFAHLVAMTPAH